MSFPPSSQEKFQSNQDTGRLRPTYHFLPPANWMNDPNGLIQWKGQYHLFYQHNPIQAAWGRIHWGHAVSHDLLHWQHQKIAMEPSPGGPDWDGVWSGCAVNAGGMPVVFYTGVSPEGQCMATSQDDLNTLEKFPGNPVIPHPPAEMKLTGFRDPCVWREGDAWYMIIGSGFEGRGGALLLYASTDLLHWEYLHPLLTADRVDSGGLSLGNMWECPQMFPLGDGYLVHFSACDQAGSKYVVYLTGKYSHEIFYPQRLMKLDYGNEFFYAPQAFADEGGRRIMLGWCREERSQEAQIQAGWAGVMSLPRLVEPRPDGLPGFRPIDELQSLRENHTHLENVLLTPGSTNPLSIFQSGTFELEAVIQPTTAGEFGINVCVNPDSREFTRLSYFPGSARFELDTTRASLDPHAPGSVHEIPSLSLERGLLHLRLFVDRSILEVYLNGWACLTARMYPTLATSQGVQVFSKGGDLRLQTLDVWTIKQARQD
jgi:beta-fructofuranosidase